MPDNDFAKRQAWIRDHQLDGHTYDEAVRLWNVAENILPDLLNNDGSLDTESVTEPEIRDAVSRYLAVSRSLGIED